MLQAFFVHMGESWVAVYNGIITGKLGKIKRRMVVLLSSCVPEIVASIQEIGTWC